MNNSTITLTAILFFIFLILGLIACRVYSKYEVCEVYYKELGRFSCMFSDYGLPNKKGVGK